VTARTQDDAFREIQLNGKQLVFLFMVATVFSVVVFLCGVFVGRGVRAERAPLIADGGTAVTTPDVVASQEPVAPPAGSDPTAAAPPPAVDELSYFNRLDKAGSTTEELKPAAPPAAAARTAPEPPPPAPAKEQKKPDDKAEAAASVAAKDAAREAPKEASKDAPKDAPKDAAASSEPAGSGFALQITALREKAEADTIARRLAAKGYTAYVMNPAKGSPSVYRVRIGKFKTRREAEAIATRLKNEEQFTPWVTR